MQHHIHSNGEGERFCFVDVGEANIFRVFEGVLLYDLEITILPPGKWQIVGKASELTEDQWSDITGVEDLSYLNHTAYPTPPPSEAGNSLLSSLGVVSDNILILKEIK